MSTNAADTSVLTCTDWRGWSSHRIAPLLQREIERWLYDFHWDQRWSFTHVEAAREAGRLPGLVATSADGVTHGWTFFLRHGQQFQIGTVVSDSPAVTRALVEAALASPLAQDATTVIFSAAAPDLETVLRGHGVATEAYDYLVRVPAASHAGPVAESAAIGRSFTAQDVVPVAALVGESYRHTAFLRPFVPSGDPGEWRDYVSQLVATRGCGEFLADASVVVDDPDATDVTDVGLVSGALLATRLSADTGHIAQVVVSPHARRVGLARRMLVHALDAFQAEGLERASLLVARTNTPARHLYESLGFQSTGTFLTGIR